MNSNKEESTTEEKGKIGRVGGNTRKLSRREKNFIARTLRR